MGQTESVQVSGTRQEVQEGMNLRLARYLEQQPEPTRAFHRRMKRLEVASLGIVAAAFIVAMYVSFHWATLPKTAIPIAWFAFAASGTPAMVLLGLHAVILRAFPPIRLPGKNQRFVTGRQALWPGWGLVFMGLAVGVFWGLFAYSVGTLNMALVEPLVRILGAVTGGGMTIVILYTIVRQFAKSR